jgi:hypothetical protein
MILIIEVERKKSQDLLSRKIVARIDKGLFDGKISSYHA